jgi:hypothetical protein
LSTHRTFLWKAGVVTDLGSSYGPAYINASGRLVDSQRDFGRLWTPTAPNSSSGTFATLAQLPAVDPTLVVQTSAQGINTAGQIVGTQRDSYFDGETSFTVALRGIRWINGVPQELPLETASAINDAGDIIGGRGGRAFLLTTENFAMPLVTISDATVTEGNTGATNAVFTVSLSKASTQTVTIHVATANGTATAGSDYLATAATVTFTPGQTSRTFTVPVLGDRIADYGETFTVALSNPSNAVVAGTAATGTIRDDEPTVSAPSVTVLEKNSGSTTATITVNLSNPYDQPITLTFATRDDTATAGSDYVATSGTLTFAPGETARQIAVAVLGDRVAEFAYSEWDGSLLDTEYLSLAFTSPAGNATVITRGSVGIREDEPLVIISPYIIATEPATGTIDAHFTVGLSAPYDQDVIVEYRAYDGGYEGSTPASAGSDYVATSGSLRIPAGQTSRTISVPIVGDGVAEETEYFQVILNGSSGNAAIDAYAAYGIGEIRDYDGRVKTWIGAGGAGSGGNWSTAANWSPSGVPGLNDLVTISGKSVILSASANVGTLTLGGGAALTVGANGSGELRTSSISIAGAGSKLNLTNNKLIVSGGDIAAITALIKSGRNGGAWNGSGIVTSSASGNLTTLGVAASGGDVTVKFTYGGDANLDGKINVDDYGRIDFNVNLPGASGWFNGDFNYDGKINVDDYGIIDFNVGIQGPPLSSNAPPNEATSTASESVPPPLSRPMTPAQQKIRDPDVFDSVFWTTGIL